MSHGEAVARGKPSEPRASSTRGSEVLEVYGPPTRLAEVESEASAPRPEDAAHRHERLDPRPRRPQRLRRLRGRARGRRTSRTSSSCSPARRSADGDRGADVELGRLERPGDDRRPRPRGRQLLVVLALGDVLVDGRADDLPARVRLRLRLAREHDQRLPTTSSSSARERWRRPSSSRSPSRRCSGRSSSTSSSARTTRSSPRRSTPRSSSPPRRCGSRRAPASTAACRWSWRSSFGLDPAWGMLTVPFIALV